MASGWFYICTIKLFIETRFSFDHNVIFQPSMRLNFWSVQISDILKIRNGFAIAITMKWMDFKVPCMSPTVTNLINTFFPFQMRFLFVDALVHVGGTNNKQIYLKKNAYPTSAHYWFFQYFWHSKCPLFSTKQKQNVCLPKTKASHVVRTFLC